MFDRRIVFDKILAGLNRDRINAGYNPDITPVNNAIPSKENNYPDTLLANISFSPKIEPSHGDNNYVTLYARRIAKKDSKSDSPIN